MNKKSKVGGLIKSIKNFTDKNSPTILTVCTVAGIISTAVAAAKAAPKINAILEEEAEKGSSNIEKAKALAPAVLPPVLIGAATIGCAVGANTISSKRIATLSAAYSIADTAAKELADKTKAAIGEKKFNEVKNDIYKNKLENNKVTEDEVLITNNGDTLCYDAWSGRYFMCSIEFIKKKINELNYRLMSENYIQLNEMYYELGLDNVKMGNNFGWNIENGLIEPWFSSQLMDDDRQVFIVDFNCGPVWLT